MPRYIHVDRDSIELFTEVQASILEKFKELSLSSSALQIHSKDSNGCDILIKDKDDLIHATDSCDGSICTLYVQQCKKLTSSNINYHIITSNIITI